MLPCACVSGQNRFRGLGLYTGADVGTDRLAARMNTGASAQKYDRVRWGAELPQREQRPRRVAGCKH